MQNYHDLKSDQIWAKARPTQESYITPNLTSLLRYDPFRLITFSLLTVVLFRVNFLFILRENFAAVVCDHV